MAGPFVYKPPVTPVYYPQEFPRPQPPQYDVHTPPPNHYFNPDRRLPHHLHFQLRSRHHHPVSHPAAWTPGGYVLPNAQQEGRGFRRWTPPPQRSRSVPPVHSGQEGPSRSLETRHQRQGPVHNQRGRGPHLNILPRPDEPVDEEGRPARLYINFWINAHRPRADFVFDLSSVQYAPRVYRHRRLVRLDYADLMKPATQPPSIRMRILIETIPQWPCVVAPRSTRAALSPITLRDVLRTLHKHLHWPILPSDWDELVSNKRNAVAQAFRRRCLETPDLYVEGVKRVDYLLGKTMMVGLWWIGHRDGCEIMTLVTNYVPN